MSLCLSFQCNIPISFLRVGCSDVHDKTEVNCRHVFESLYYIISLASYCDEVQI